MTLRSVLIGLLGAVAICGFGFFNDRVMRQTFITGNHMPISVYGMLVVFLLVVNPLLLRLCRRAAFSARELAVVLAIVLPACFVPGRGFIHIFTSVVMMPRHYERTDPGWKKHDIVRMAPDVMLAGVEPEYADGDITDAQKAFAKLVLPLANDASPALVEVRSLIGADTLAALRDAREEGDEEGDESAIGPACADALNELVVMDELFDEVSFPRASLSVEADELLGLPDRKLSARDRRRINRHCLDFALKGDVLSLSAKEEYAINGFIQGLGVGTTSIALSKVPWYAWRRTLLFFWMPMVVCLSIAVLGLALVTHRQWSSHEHMPYPIVVFASSLMPQEGQSRGSVFTNRSFLIAGGVVLAIHLNNYAFEWWPEYLVSFPLQYDFRSLSHLMPALQRGGDWALMDPTIYFTAIGFAYFVSTDVSFSLGLAPFVYAMVLGTFAGYGISLGGGGHISLKIEGFLYGGSHFGMFLVILYTGRRYFASVFKRSVFLSSPDEVETSAVWGARVFIVTILLFILQLVLVGLTWQWAVLYTGITIVLFVVMTRVMAEAGTFFIHPYAYPGVLLWGFFGGRALGPLNMLIMFIVTTVLVIDPREAVMPFVTHALKLADDQGVKLGRIAGLGAAALVLGLAVAVPAALYTQYDKGAEATGDWWTRNDPRFSYDAVVREQNKLEAQGYDLEAEGEGVLEWMGSVSPNWGGVLAFAIAAGLVISFTAARLRFARWPFHPVMFIVLATWASRKLAVSYLIGCLIKMVVTKYGGLSGYQKMKPVMIGIIAGDMLGGITPMVIGAIYYYFTGEPPKSYTVLPL